MPLENQSPEEIVQNSSQKKGFKLSIILLVLILLAGSYLAYSMYSDTQSSNKQDTEVSNTMSPEDSLEASSTISQVQNNDNSSTLDSSTEKKYTLSQVAENNNKNSCWTIIAGNIYNITSYVPNHPGGEEEILKICGKDGSSLFAKPKEHKEGGANNVLNSFKIGILSQ
ncbi:MAG: cytochrome b5-like heme/steroid binding domain-containing protein [Candidatus Paceibacterota bacterium]